MTSIGIEELRAAATPGGASVLTSRTELKPAAGPLAGVAPARFVDGSNGTYAFETRYGDENDEAVSVVIIDSRGSSNNRIEGALSQAIRDGHPLLTRTPRLTISYEGREAVTELDLPHRVFDGHIRSGEIDGRPATDHSRYRTARNATPADAKAMLETSPISLVLGSWDSTRGFNQARYRSLITGEIIGVLADQSNDGRIVPRRGAARTDSIAASVKLSGADMEKILASQEAELSAANVVRIRGAIKKAGTSGTVSGSTLGLGSIPPSLDGIGFVSCRTIVRHHVLSFAALRQLRFGLDTEGNVHARVLLAALALNGLARSDAELLIRANCDLVEAGPTEVALDGRFGLSTPYDALTIEEADVLLEAAIDAAVAAGVCWAGQTLDVVGNPLIAGGLSADDAGE